MDFWRHIPRAYMCILLTLGDAEITYQKNVYSVFRYDSPAVGFAQLSDVALAMNGDVRAAVPAATIGSIAAQVSATSVVDRTNGALSGSSISPALTFVAALTTVFILLS